MKNAGKFRKWAADRCFIGVGLFVLSIGGGSRALGHENLKDGPVSRFDGRLATYIGYALRKSPVVQASFERWRAETLRISRGYRLPEPTISYGYFIQSVETRVGPQRHKLSLAQTFPWMTKLSARTEAASFRASAARRRFEALVLEVKMRTAEVYWRLWLVQEEHRLKSEHDLVLENLAGTIRGRIETGRASLADLNQVELGIARHHDHHGQHHETLRSVSARLRARIGAPTKDDMLTATDTPEQGPILESATVLRRLAETHPRIEAFGLMASASGARARAEAADRLPRFRVGIDYIETGEAGPSSVVGSGKDAMIASLGISLPLWLGSYQDAEDAARADGRAHMADGEAARQEAAADFHGTLARARDAYRRIGLYRDTLLLQAETTFRSVLGGYQSGQTTVAASLLAQKDLLELQLELARARTEYVRALARLQYIVGRPVKTATEPEVFDE